jgi:hypothetical protein
LEAASLPELADVPWRRRATDASLTDLARLWTLTTLAHVVPFCLTAALLVAIRPWLAPVALLALTQAWVIPELYANRGAKVVRPRPRGDAGPEAVAAGLLGDLVGHEARAVHARTDLVPERGAFGTWLVGEAGALLVRPGGGPVLCWCVRVPDPELPAGDRVASLLLALREDEAGFATVANLAFAGAAWRVRRRLPPAVRPALDAARRRPA